MTARPLLSFLALLVAGCTGAADGGYPSLARRPVEGGGLTSPAAPGVPAEEESDASLDADIGRLAAQAQAGASAFDDAYPDVERQVHAAAGAGVSSDAWVAAQVAISGLESDRNGSVSALAGLDALYADRVNAVADGKAKGGDQAIDAARREVLALVDSQNDRLDRLKALLPQP